MATPRFTVAAGDWDIPVSLVRMVCHTSGRVGNTNMSENHWSLYFIIASNKSVRFNMRAEPGYVDGILDLSSHNYVLTSSSIKYWDYATTASFTVRGVYALITTSGYNRYTMSGGGSGCRWWM